jgi:hypothetical protein
MSFLMAIALMLVGFYHGGCVGYTKNYQWEPTEREKEEIIERAAEKMAEEQLKEAKK